MIIINQKLIKANFYQGASSPEKSSILEKMGKYNRVYEYETLGELEFDLDVRVRIIRAAVLLSRSGADFETFQNSRCNKQYWKRAENGAFFLKPNVSPHIAIGDIFRNGRKYGFECSTAMVIIFYKAVLDSIGKEHFNKIFSGLFLYGWEYDKNLDLHTYIGNDFLPGDCVYFNNPDYNPDTPEWRGENAIILDENLYFAHGIGIKPGLDIIAFLHSFRKANAVTSAYLVPQITRINYKRYMRYNSNRKPCLNEEHLCDSTNLIISNIGSKTFIL